MNLERFRTKLIRRVTSPLELTYDLMSHWFVVLLAVSLGVLIMFAKVTSEPPRYECTATLVLSQGEVVIETDSTRKAPPAANEARFTQEQLSLLQSDSVIEKVARQIGDEGIMLQEDDPEWWRQLGLLQRTYRKARDKVLSVVQLFQRAPEASAEEQARDRAKASFRRRSTVDNPMVKSNQPSNIIKLGLFGPQHDLLKEEMQAWIEAYRVRIEEISEETYQRLFTSRVDYWVRKEKEARQELDLFKEKNPGVNALQLQAAQERVLRLKMALDDLNRQGGLGFLRDGGGHGGLSPAGGAALPEERFLERLRQERFEREMELADLEARFTPKNEKVKAKRAQIKVLDGQITRLEEQVRLINQDLHALEGAQQADAEDAKDDTIARIAVERRKLIKEITAQLDQAYADHAALDSMMQEKLPLEEAHKHAAFMLNKFETLMDTKTEEVEIHKLVDVQVHDKPTTSIHPMMENQYQQIGLGALGGFLAGFLIAFNLELFNRRLRYRRDVEDELQLKVVGVIPER